MQDKPVSLEVKEPIKCVNCERTILAGETATRLPDVNMEGTQGGVLCSDCHPQKGETKEEKAARLAAEKAAKEAEKAGK